jgi:hypothetical protein
MTTPPPSPTRTMTLQCLAELLQLIRTHEALLVHQHTAVLADDAEDQALEAHEMLVRLAAAREALAGKREPKFQRGDRVRKTSGSSWQGEVVGEYSTALTPEGYAVESEREPGSVQIYPAKALELVPE